MTLDDLKDRIIEGFNGLKSKIEESPYFQTAKERFETLSPKTQGLITWSAIGFVTLMIVSCPYSYYSSSSEQISQFDEIRSMIRNLLRASQTATQLSGMSSAMDISTAQSRIQSEVQQLGLQSEQIGPVTTIAATELGPLLAPSAIEQHAISVVLKKLNLKQLVEIGHRLQSIQGTLKLAGMDLVGLRDNDHYFDVTYQLINFSLGAKNTTTGTPDGAEAGRFQKESNRSQDDEEIPVDDSEDLDE